MDKLFIIKVFLEKYNDLSVAIFYLKIKNTVKNIFHFVKLTFYFYKIIHKQ